MRRIHLAVTAAILAAAVSTAHGVSAVSTSLPAVIGASTFTLFAGQTTDAGDVTVAVTGADLTVTFATTGGWTLDEAHLWVGTSLVSLPKTKAGNPVPGRFPYTATSIGDTSVSFTIPLASLGFACPTADTTYLLAAHASVTRPSADGSEQQETAWSEGTRFVSRGNWGTYSAFTLGCVTPPVRPEPDTCETAFAYSPNRSTEFGDLGFSRWGWTNGPLDIGTYEFELWAAVGNYNFAAGRHVGTVAVQYDGNSMSVKTTTFGGFGLGETQLYVGETATPLARQGQNWEPTVAPGQYGNIHDGLAGAQVDTFTIDASGLPYLILHANVCGQYGR